ncbi:MAG: hypothetical protein ABSA13_01545 [Beijerinckiaceae bacterium]
MPGIDVSGYSRRSDQFRGTAYWDRRHGVPHPNMQSPFDFEFVLIDRD